MDDLISRQAAIDALIEWYGCEPSDIGAFENIVKQLPSADAVERKRGRWVRKNIGGWHCSECDNQAPFPCMASCQYLTDFCPNCGADMRGEANESLRNICDDITCNL